MNTLLCTQRPSNNCYNEINDPGPDPGPGRCPLRERCRPPAAVEPRATPGTPVLCPASITIVTIATIDTIATMLHGMGPFIKSVASYVCTQIICFYSSLLLNACRDHVDYVYFVTSEIFDNIKYPDLHPSIVYAYNRYKNKYTVGRWRHGLSPAFAGGLSLHLTFSGNIFAT